MFWKDLLVDAVFGYETQKVLLVKSRRIGVLFRFLQLCILCYVVLWIMVYEHGYQTEDSLISGATAKVKGLTSSPGRRPRRRIWDPAEYMVPPQQNSGFFITTNAVITRNQTLAYCAESPENVHALCVNDSQCVENRLDFGLNGPLTGRCVRATNTCEVYAWCPVENKSLSATERLSKTYFKEVVNFTVLIKNSVKFRNSGVKRRNIFAYMTDAYLKSCTHHPQNDPYCPVFRFGDIFRFAGANTTNLLQFGGIVAIVIDWQCNLDWAIDNCKPKYTFKRLDEDKSEHNSLLANSPDESEQIHDATTTFNMNETFAAANKSHTSLPIWHGWNFRHAYHYTENRTKRRMLIKAYGIQFFIHVTGVGWKFNLQQFSMNLGSGLALFGGAALFCDFLVLNLMKNRKEYREAKCDVLLHDSVVAACAAPPPVDEAADGDNDNDDDDDGADDDGADDDGADDDAMTGQDDANKGEGRRREETAAHSEITADRNLDLLQPIDQSEGEDEQQEQKDLQADLDAPIVPKLSTSTFAASSSSDVSCSLAAAPFDTPTRNCIHEIHADVDEDEEFRSELSR